MRFIKTFFILWVSLLFLTACTKQYEKSESRLIIIKSKHLKYADLGYLYRNSDEVRADLFVAGKLVERLEVSTLVCVNEGCLTKAGFNERYLHPSYPDDLILNVLLARPIFEQASLQRTPTGFIQTLKSDQYNIIYKIENGDIYFKDKQNRLMIKISKLKG